MKKKLLGTVLALVLTGGALTACSTAYANSPSTNATPLTASTIAYAPQIEQLATTANTSTFASPNITVSEAAWQSDQIPADAIPMEEAAQIGARYLWDVFGVDIDGMHIVMLYSDCWLRPFAGRWTGSVYLTEEESLANEWISFSDGAVIINPALNAVVSLADRRFSFTIDSTTGERLETASRSTTPSPAILHDTQTLWESAHGLEIQAMSDNELAAFVGLTSEQLEIYTQKVTAFAEAHFNNSTLQNVELCRNVSTPNGAMRLQGIQPLLDTNADGSIFGTLSGLEFTVTDDTGREAIVTISIWMDSISLRTAL